LTADAAFFKMAEAVKGVESHGGGGFTQYGEILGSGTPDGWEGGQEPGEGQGVDVDAEPFNGTPPTCAAESEDPEGVAGGVGGVRTQAGGEVRTVAEVLDALGIMRHEERRQARDKERELEECHAPQIAREMDLSDPSQDNPDATQVATPTPNS
jgi:hypothetical protein